MAATGSALPQFSSLPRVHTAHRNSRLKRSPQNACDSPLATVIGRRRSMFLLTASTMLTAGDVLKARAQDIPLFGIRKKLEKVEKEAEEVLKEGIEKAEKGIETAEKGIEAAEREIVMAEGEIEAAVSFGGLAQAGVVAGAEFLGVVVASSVVNGILGSENQ